MPILSWFKYRLMYVYIYIRCHYLSLKYDEPVDNIYKAYINSYGSFKIINDLLRNANLKGRDFVDDLNDFIKMKEQIEEYFESIKKELC